MTQKEDDPDRENGDSSVAKDVNPEANPTAAEESTEIEADNTAANTDEASGGAAGGPPLWWNKAVRAVLGLILGYFGFYLIPTLYFVWQAAGGDVMGAGQEAFLKYAGAVIGAVGLLGFIIGGKWTGEHLYKMLNIVSLFKWIQKKMIGIPEIGQSLIIIPVIAGIITAMFFVGKNSAEIDFREDQETQAAYATQTRIIEIPITETAIEKANEAQAAYATGTREIEVSITQTAIENEIATKVAENPYIPANGISVPIDDWSTYTKKPWDNSKQESIGINNRNTQTAYMTEIYLKSLPDAQPEPGLYWTKPETQVWFSWDTAKMRVLLDENSPNGASASKSDSPMTGIISTVAITSSPGHYVSDGVARYYSDEKIYCQYFMLYADGDGNQAYYGTPIHIPLNSEKGSALVWDFTAFPDAIPEHMDYILDRNAEKLPPPVLEYLTENDGRLPTFTKFFRRFAELWVWGVRNNEITEGLEGDYDPARIQELGVVCEVSAASDVATIIPGYNNEFRGIFEFGEVTVFSSSHSSP